MTSRTLDGSLDPTTDKNLADEATIRITFLVVMTSLVISGVCAAIYCRGLYQDGAYYLYRMAEREWFYLYDPARTTVQAVRQAPVVLMLKLGNFSLFQLGQIFSLAMLLLPPALVGLCWFIAPRGRKLWTLLPAAHLPLGFSTMSFEAVGEAAIATAYFWILLFMLLFRTRQWPSQLLFVILCAGAFQTHEGACLLMPVLLLAIGLRVGPARSAERVFLAGVAIMIFSIMAYEVRWMIYPRLAGQEEGAILAILTFGFLYFEGHVNVAAVVALAAAAGFASVAFVNTFPSNVARRYTGWVGLAFAIFALAMIAAAWLVEQCVTPGGQSLSRYNPVFASIVLGILAALGVSGKAPGVALISKPALPILLVLCVAQLGIDLAATSRWRLFIGDFEDRLARSQGLVDWASTLTGDKVRDDNWRLMTVGWVHPIMSIILSRNGDVRSILDYPPGTPFQPISLADPDKLPTLPGVSYDKYRQSVRPARVDHEPEK